MRFNRIWLIALAVIVAIAAIAWGQPLNLAKQSAKQSPSGAIVQAQAPTPEAPPTPETPPSPEVPSTPEVPSPSPTALPLAETPYQDPGGRFQLGIIQGFNQSVVAGVPLFESPDGKLAYTVSVRPRAADAPLREWALTQVAMDTFSRGEGILTGDYETVESELGGAVVPWEGRVTTREKVEDRIETVKRPIEGLLLSRQIPGRLLILAIAATESAASQIDAVYSTLEPTLQEIEE